MQAFTPMLCWRSHSHLEDVVRAMHRQRNVFDPARQLEPGEYGNREFLVEEKLDGERIQLHKQGNKFQYFSRQVCFVFRETGQGGLETDDRGYRRATDYTWLYGENASAGSLTPFLGDALHEDVEELGSLCTLVSRLRQPS